MFHELIAKLPISGAVAYSGKRSAIPISGLETIHLRKRMHHSKVYLPHIKNITGVHKQPGGPTAVNK